jgi:hypothetical protein
MKPPENPVVTRNRINMAGIVFMVVSPPAFASMDTVLGELISFHPEMALFRNLGVNLRNYLCDVHMYVSAQFLDFLDVAKNCSSLKWKPASDQI